MEITIKGQKNLTLGEVFLLAHAACVLKAGYVTAGGRVPTDKDLAVETFQMLAAVKEVQRESTYEPIP
jgi:hypothetical protein